MITRAVAILGTVHEIQGAEKYQRRKVEDPAYLALIKQFLPGKDFVFEEASALGPTKAEQLASEQLGKDRYLDVDPHVSERPAYRIGETGQSSPINPYDGSTDSVRREFEEEQSKREYLWIGKIEKAEFTSALFICGYLHTLSLSYKLREAGFRVESWTYVPYAKLCPLPHGSEKTY
jgi:hypothetical protein